MYFFTNFWKGRQNQNFACFFSGYFFHEKKWGRKICLAIILSKSSYFIIAPIWGEDLKIRKIVKLCRAQLNLDMNLNRLFETKIQK